MNPNAMTEKLTDDTKSASRTFEARALIRVVEHAENYVLVVVPALSLTMQIMLPHSYFPKNVVPCVGHRFHAVVDYKAGHARDVIVGFYEA